MELFNYHPSSNKRPCVLKIQKLIIVPVSNVASRSAKSTEINYRPGTIRESRVCESENGR